MMQAGYRKSYRVPVLVELAHVKERSEDRKSYTTISEGVKTLAAAHPGPAPLTITLMEEIPHDAITLLP